jgi:hypothetical protein
MSENKPQAGTAHPAPAKRTRAGRSVEKWLTREVTRVLSHAPAPSDVAVIQTIAETGGTIAATVISWLRAPLAGKPDEPA